jgi:hypothetical protein
MFKEANAMDGKAKQDRGNQIVAQFNIIDKTTPKEQFLDEYQNCPLCGTSMVYTHVTNFVAETVKEEAFCTACNIRTKSNDHGLQ